MATNLAASGAHPIVGRCIYCGSTTQLSDEHVLPYGLGGKLVLKRASCRSCAKVTAALEQRLLRGHWWPYRQILGIKTRSASYPKYRPVSLISATGEKRPAKVLSEDYPIVLFLDFDPPSILSGETGPGAPFAKAMFLKQVGMAPSRVLDEGVMRSLMPWEKIEYPTDFESSDLLRFVAKVAHGYAIHEHGLSVCANYYLPQVVLGTGDGSLTHVGGCSSEILKPKLPSTELHGLLDRKQNGRLIVNLQLFRDAGDLPPIYEAVVGEIAAENDA